MIGIPGSGISMYKGLEARGNVVYSKKCCVWDGRSVGCLVGVGEQQKMRLERHVSVQLSAFLPAHPFL